MNRRKCLFCKEWFIPKESSRKFCSHDCSLKYKLTVRQSDTGTLLYRRYTDMKQRVNNQKSIRSNRYYERGISICKEWQESYIDFKEWALSHGYKDGLSLDRIDVDKEYCPENCRWIAKRQQYFNKSTNLFYEYKGETKTMTEWALEYGLKPRQLRTRLIVQKWPIEKALNEPIKKVKENNEPSFQVKGKYKGLPGFKSEEYYLWMGIKSRRDTKIKPEVCQEWKDPDNGYKTFCKWLNDNGFNHEKQENGRNKLTIDRIDPYRGYCPENCRLVDVMVQNNNKTNSVRITINNETKTLAEWARIYNIKYDLVYDRIKRGWDPFKALTECNQTKKRTRMLRYKDKEMKVTDWAKELGVSIRTISRYSQTPEDFVRFIERYNNIKEKK